MDNLETSLVNSDSSPPLEKPKISITGSPLERLNKGQLEFCVAYSNFGSETYHNATLSAIKAGYSVKTAGVKGSRLVSHSKTRAGIDYLEKGNDVELAKVFDIERPVFLKEMVDSMRELDAKAPNRPRYAEIIAKVKGFYSDGLPLYIANYQ
jgi:hypothetical protein